MNIRKVAVVGHFFYLEQMETIVDCLRNIPLPFDLFVSVTESGEKAVNHLLEKAFPDKKVSVRAVPNRGYDIAPFVCAFRDVYPAYDLVLKIHTKKSSHTYGLEKWGDYLLKNTIGSPEIMETTLKMFEEYNNLGLVYPEMIPVFKQELAKDPWQGNWDLCQEFGARLGLSTEKQTAPDFPAGSMFWFRPKALEPLLQLGLCPEDFPEGKYFYRNGTLAHAIERLFVLIAQKQGFRTTEVCFHPFKGVRDGSLWGRIRNAACCEWERWMHRMGRNR